eukprot:IDg5902t1
MDACRVLCYVYTLARPKRWGDALLSFRAPEIHIQKLYLRTVDPCPTCTSLGHNEG